MLYASSIEESYSNPTGFVAPPVLSKAVAPTDDYILHATVKKQKNHAEKTYVFVVTRTTYYKLDHESHQKIWCRNINEIYSVHEDDEDPCKLKMIYRKAAGSSSIKSKVLASDAANITNNTSTRYLTFDTQEVRDEWLVVIRRILGDIWQALLEGSFVNPPEVYQSHFYVEKVNRKGKLQMRCLIISTVSVYNIEVKSGLSLAVQITNVYKWVFPITALTNLLVYNNPTNVLVIKINTAHLQKVKPVTALVLHDQSERDLVTAEIRRLYFQKKKYHLPKEVGSTWESPGGKSKKH